MLQCPDYHKEVVKRFLGQGTGPINRLAESATYSCFVTQDSISRAIELPASAGLHDSDLLGLLRIGDNGAGGASVDRGDQANDDGLPSIPILVVVASLGAPTEVERSE